MLNLHRFNGHLDMADPRTPVHAAAGCTWPSIPAYRYLLVSANAYGVLAPLNTTGILVEQAGAGPSHDAMQYNMIAAPPPILFAILYKNWVEDPPGYEWDIGIVASMCGILQTTLEFPIQKCNVDFTIGEMSCSGYYGGTGSTFQAKQVEWNRTLPPPPIP